MQICFIFTNSISNRYNYFLILLFPLFTYLERSQCKFCVHNININAMCYAIDETIRNTAEQGLKRCTSHILATHVNNGSKCIIDQYNRIYVR